MSWMPKTRIMVPVDFSEPSLKAMSLTKTMVSSPEGLHVVHVIQYAPGDDIDTLAEEMTHTQHRDETLQKLKEVAAQQGLSDCTIEVLDNYHQRGPGVTLAMHAKKIAAELIVIPTHGYTGLRRVLMGSVADQVIRHAECPVLVLPPEHHSN